MIQKSTAAIRLPRVPEPVQGIQVNFCRNPKCANFGVPVSMTGGSGRQPDDNSGGYKIVGFGAGIPGFQCQVCGVYAVVKSNMAVFEERERLAGYLRLKVPAAISPACKTPQCPNHGITVAAQADAYQSFGKTAAGSARWRCKACRKLVSQPASTILRQRRSHENKLILKLLMNKSPMRRICEVAEISPCTLYRKIDFLHRQFLGFAASREAALPEKEFISLRCSTDGQDYLVNWTERSDKRPITLTAIGTADEWSGYVFGMNLNYDGSVTKEAVEEEAQINGDPVLPLPHRRHARLWMPWDYDAAVAKSEKELKVKRRSKSVSIEGDILETYAGAASREDTEAGPDLTDEVRLPETGVQVRSDYLSYGHFFFLSSLLQKAKHVRFYLDQDPSLRGACLAAFADRMKGSDRTADAFYVKITKDMTQEEKRRSVGPARELFFLELMQEPEAKKYKSAGAFKKKAPKLYWKIERRVRIAWLKREMKRAKLFGQWDDIWIAHPLPTMSEPEKHVCMLTNFDGYTEDRVARMLDRGSLKAIDRFFMQVRRRLKLAERPIASAGNSRRMWHGYAPYNPEILSKMLEIYRVFFNFVSAGDKKETPAMRLGLAEAPIRIETILAFK